MQQQVKMVIASSAGCSLTKSFYTSGSKEWGINFSLSNDEFPDVYWQRPEATFLFVPRMDDATGNKS